jgi:hypothetical protein
MMNKDIKTLDLTTIDEEVAEKKAIEAEKRFQEFYDKMESGNLTAEEKASIDYTDKLLEEGF